MDQAYLLQTASALRQPPVEASLEFDSHAEAIAAELTRRMAARPDIDRLVGAGNIPMMEDNSRNFTRFMSSIFRRHNPEVLVQTSLWAVSTYRAHGFSIAYWPANLDTFMEILKTRLSAPSFAAVAPFVEWLILGVPAFAALAESHCGHPSDHVPPRTNLP